MYKIKKNVLETAICDYCGCKKTRTVTRQTDLIHKTTNFFFNIVKCKNCGLHFTNPRPNLKNIGKYYPKSYSYHSSTSLFKAFLYRAASYVSNNNFLAWFFSFVPGISDKLIEFIKPQIPDPVRLYYRNGGKGVMLDIGCGAGFTANFWGSSGSIISYQSIAKTAGIEINLNARQALIRRGIKVYDDISRVPFSNKFGVIRMNWSLEHVHSPSRYFQFIKNHLKKDGQVIITVPNYKGLLYKLAPNAVELPIHLYHFRSVDIENYASRFGFKIVAFKSFSYPSMFIFASKIGMFPSDFFKKFRMRDARNFQSLLNRFDLNGFGNDMLIILTHQ